ncbi:MAG: type I polyketide synthase, partial [Phycisphaeraceae bacterium]|nr:type I polyketide synthase [Phycisphaeraceae bacterium]
MSHTSQQPVAIIGMGCRFPGRASNPRLYWKLLTGGRCAIVDVPADRWDIRRFYDEDPDSPGATSVCRGGFLQERIDRFDPSFFGLSVREAETMDPQQRLLLEVAWETIEDAGLRSENLAGSSTGVYVGGFCVDSVSLRFGPYGREAMDAHTATGSSHTLLSNRISHVLDLRGPSLTIDTACSSSLVALHEAVGALRRGDCDRALVGGVNLMLLPETFVAMAKGRFLSPGGCCLTFDEAADGYGRGEGAGAVMLKPLDRAVQDGDRIYATILETGLNQDGRTPGVAQPNPEAQEALLRRVYGQARIDRHRVRYVEAHGTGTQAGDVAETQALGRWFGDAAEAGVPRWVGSAKANLGHLEAAAGVAGLIKAALVLHHRSVPPQVNLNNPNPNIDWEKLGLSIPRKLESIPENGPCCAAVNSFGYGGTNAHAVLESFEPKVHQPSGAAGSSLKLLPVSGRDPQALRDASGRLAFFLKNQKREDLLADVVHTASARRTHWSRRLVALGDSVESMQKRLQNHSSALTDPDVVEAVGSAETKPPLVFVFNGMGPQWWGMGQALLREEPVFADTVQRVDRETKRWGGFSILEAMTDPEQRDGLSRTDRAQPAQFALQMGLGELLGSWSIRPEAVVGHSVGEVAAACVGGALSLEDATRVVIHRSRLQ